MDIEPEDHNAAVMGFVAKHGLPGLINLHKMDSPEKYGMSVRSGKRHIENHTKALFSGERIEKPDHSKHKDLVDDWIKNGGITGDIQEERHNIASPQMYAEGGEVERQHGKPLSNPMLESTHPEQNILLQSMKGRASDYLSSQKPIENGPKMAFDSHPDMTQMKKQYEKARNIAIHPLGVLRHVQDGSVDKDHMRHFMGLYPELHDHLQKDITKKIVESELAGEKPAYTSRQGLSTFMGTPLSGEMLPQRIQAVQNTFQLPQTPAQPQQGQAEKPKRKTSALTKSDQSFLTGNQARVMREQKQ